MKAKRVFVSLRSKMIVGITLLLFAIMSIVFFLLFNSQRMQTLKEFKKHATRLNELIEVGLKNAMIENNLNVVQDMVETLSKHRDVEKVFIINKKGKVGVSSQKDEIGKILDFGDPTCQLCHQYLPENRSKTVVFRTKGNRWVFRSVNPISNEPECHRCHDPKDKINGVLISDFSMRNFKARVVSNIKIMLFGGIATISGIGIMISLLMNSWVINRIKKFLSGTKQISKGDFRQMIKIEGNDEITELESAFNTMTIKLRNSLEEITKDKDYLENLINSIEDGVMVVDREYCIVTTNRVLLSRIKVSKERAIGEHCYKVTHNRSTPCEGENNDCPARETFKTGKFSHALHIHYDENGEQRWVEIYASPVKDERMGVYQVIVVNRDITKRKILERHLLQSEKLISMGKLAATVAHEINNPLCGVLTFIKVISNNLKKKQLSDSDIEQVRKYLSTIEGETARCGRIVTGLLGFSRQSELNIQLVNVNQIINKSLLLLEHKISHENIEVIKEINPNSLTVAGDFNQLQQVFMNIILNAAQAMPEGGKFTIRSSISEDKKFVEVRFTDTGCGIPKENLERLFNPFFTTKKEGKGVGLGLSVAYGIIAKHKGRIYVESSKVGVGTTFTIRLPREGV